MTIFAALVLTALAFYFVVRPFFKQRIGLATAGENQKVQELQSERDITYSMLKELEFDYHSGILSEEDYRELESRYKQKAISTLRDIDSANREPAKESDDKVESMVLELRKSRPVLKQKAVSFSKNFCSQCGEKIKETDKFCSGCGVSLA